MVKRALKGVVRRLKGKTNFKSAIADSKPWVKYKLLLLTNKDSDNVGDQVIEACDLSLLNTVMVNLGVKNGEYIITSREASIISQKYLNTNDEKLLERADKIIKKSGILIFGGAPLFNYDHQSFYKRTILTLEIAEKYKIPTIFSSIGIEGYDEKNLKCQELKKALHLGCVKQITTRDDIDSLHKYIESDTIITDKVSDPAVFCSKVFEKIAFKQKKKTIGLFVVRSKIFQSNGIEFSHEKQIKLWKDIIAILEHKGYDYELITTGHFSDEVFLDSLSRESNIPLEKFVFNVNNPEVLINKISLYAGVIAYRLHANIISFAYDVPAIGLEWNQKVPLFYESIGYPERAFGVGEWKADMLVTALEKAMKEGVNKDPEYLMTVYNTLFNSLKNIIKPDSDIRPYTYDELLEKCVVFEGTTEKEKEEKLKRKMRRIYQSYHKLLNP